MTDEWISKERKSEIREHGRILAKRLTFTRVIGADALSVDAEVERTSSWIGPSLAGGSAGIALLHAQAAFTFASSDEGLIFRDSAGAFLRHAAASTLTHPFLSASLFSGTSGLTLSARIVSKIEPRFTNALLQLEQTIVDQVDTSHDEPAERGLRSEDFDLISGDAGTLLYLANQNESRSFDHSVETLRTRLAENFSGIRTATLREGIAIYPENYPNPATLADFPSGYVNTGLSHGAAGVLLALSMSKHAEKLAGNRQTVSDLSEWLIEVGNSFGWGQGVSIQQDSIPNRNEMWAWCYGTPGVGVSLLAAANELGSIVIRQQAISQFETAFEKWLLVGPVSMTPTICHGLAGIAICASAFARAGSVIAQESMATLAGWLIDACDLSTPLGVQDQATGGAAKDDPGLLTGSAGVALALLTMSSPPIPGALMPFTGGL